MDYNEGLRSWFCVLNNPEEHGYEGMDSAAIAEKALEDWIQGKITRTGMVAYCISADGLKHLHMVLCDSNKARFSAIKKAYPAAHIAPTRGNKEQAEDYINKRGKWEEKGEEIIYIAKYGEIKGNKGKAKDLEIIEEFINQGMTPEQIMKLSLSYRQYSTIIKEAFFSKRKESTAFKRDVKVVWHVGEAGSGKSYTSISLVEQYGEDEVYMLTDYDRGGLDKYGAERVLFMDEFRGQIPYSTLLTMLDGYKVQLHARYTNVLSLWEEVHITSVLPPNMVYKRMVKEDTEIDTIQQLNRRIDMIVYHYKEGDEYKSYSIPMTEYTTLEELRSKATCDEDGFMKVTPEQQAEIADLL